jgi:hypothetical protein
MVTMKAFLNNKLNKVLTKGGELEMKAKWAFSIIAVISLVLALSPGVAFAAEGGTAAGSFGCGNSAPDVTVVTLYNVADETVTSMTPQMEYYVKVTISDANTLNDLDTVKVYIYYDANGVYDDGDRPGTGNTQTCAILTWTNPSTWTIDPTGGGATWTQETSTVPTLTGASGDFEFHFKPGKVATESPDADEWHIYAVADDGTATDSLYQEDCNMAWYGEITVNSGTVNWGSVTAGMDFGEGAPSENGSISVKYLANGAYDEKVAANSSWTGVPSGTATLNASGTPSANEFSLKADDTGTLPGGSNGLVTASPSYITIDDSGALTTESGDTVATNALWLKLGTPFSAATYSGTIYYQIADGS